MNAELKSEHTESVTQAPPEADWIGWTACPKCFAEFLGVLEARMRCPNSHCGLEFTVKDVHASRHFRFGDAHAASSNFPKMIERIEMWCARRWAETSADGTPEDTRDWARAWATIRAIKRGEHLQFVTSAAAFLRSDRVGTNTARK